MTRRNGDGELAIRAAIEAAGQAMAAATWPAQQRAVSTAREWLFAALLLFQEETPEERALGVSRDSDAV